MDRDTENRKIIIHSVKVNFAIILIKSPLQCKVGEEHPQQQQQVHRSHNQVYYIHMNVDCVDKQRLNNKQ